ncbi:hypothetical protein U9M48_016742 [Paspalum notatum var. saurae]|uniref:Uncharacterized protein n=1 Tax=Paspalum notatum var. saurae TaxID=547442 RepID=A0AAQ3T6T2_PASNO
MQWSCVFRRVHFHRDAWMARWPERKSWLMSGGKRGLTADARTGLAFRRFGRSSADRIELGKLRTTASPGSRRPVQLAPPVGDRRRAVAVKTAKTTGDTTPPPGGGRRRHHQPRPIQWKVAWVAEARDAVF